MTPGANFGNFQLSPYLALNFRKNITMFDYVLLLLPKLLVKKPPAWWKTPPKSYTCRVKTIALKEIYKETPCFDTLFEYLTWHYNLQSSVHVHHCASFLKGD